MLERSSENLLHSVFQTLAYADVFNYPLTAREIHRYLTLSNISLDQVTQTLQERAFFSNIGDYYTLSGREEIVQTRRRREKVAQRLWQKAARYARFLARLPFVRMVAVTGSLAMNNTEDGNDIDYMIVTAPSHLWTCRALTLLVARIAKLEHVSLCPNYLVTTHALKIEEHSLYVAHEMTQMIPVFGMETYAEMRRLNNWLTDYLPNALKAPEFPVDVTIVPEQPALQHAIEFLFRTPFGTWFERWEMQRKIRRLSQEQALSSESYFSADVCKGHIDRHKQKTESAIQEKIKQIPVEF